MAADWLVSAWDQNTGSRQPTPATAAARGGRREHGCSTCSGCPRTAVWGSHRSYTAEPLRASSSRATPCCAIAVTTPTRGIRSAAAHPVPCRRCRAHVGRSSAGRIAGSERPETVGADDQGRIDVAGLSDALAEHDGPRSWHSRPATSTRARSTTSRRAIDVAHLHGAWVHVDGAFGLWAAASPRLQHLIAGGERADSWATDAHKTLNVPYDCGVAIVRNEAAMSAALGAHAALPSRRGHRRRPLRPRSRSSRAAPAECRCGRRCGRWAAAA